MRNQFLKALSHKELERRLQAFELTFNNVLNERYGVCSNAQLHYDALVGARPDWGDEIYTTVDELSQDWPHRTGPSAFFVPYEDALGLWEGRNKEMRHDLLHFMIAKIEKEQEARALESAVQDVFRWCSTTELVAVLNGMNNIVGHVRYPEVGICSNFYCGEYLHSVVHLWPEWSGSAAYPVPHPTLTCYTAFNTCDNLWVGEYGEARKRLLAWFKGVLEQEVARRNELKRKDEECNGM